MPRKGSVKDTPVRRPEGLASVLTNIRACSTHGDISVPLEVSLFCSRSPLVADQLVQCPHLRYENCPRTGRSGQDVTSGVGESAVRIQETHQLSRLFVVVNPSSGKCSPEETRQM